MGRENKKDVVAALHREQIMKAAEKLFSEKGYVQKHLNIVDAQFTHIMKTKMIFCTISSKRVCRH